MAKDALTAVTVYPRANVLGVGVSAINLDQALAAVVQALTSKTKGYITVTGVHGVSETQDDINFRHILNSSFLTTPDGMPMVWMGRLQGYRHMGRVYGPDLMLRVCEHTASTTGHTHFFYGGAPGVAGELKHRLEARLQGLRVVGTYTPPFRDLEPHEQRALTEQLEICSPDIVWVGLSTPKQERFMARYYSSLPGTLFIGVGAAFDFFTGRLRQAPLWMQRSGLEWFFRLACEPRRLWKRYLRNNPLFLIRAAAQISGLRKYSLE